MNNNFLIDNIIDCICLEGDGGCSSYSYEMKNKMIVFMESLRTGNYNIVTVSDWLDYLDSIGDTFSQELRSDVNSIIADEIREGNWTGNEWEIILMKSAQISRITYLMILFVSANVLNLRVLVTLRISLRTTTGQYINYKINKT